MSDCLFCKIAGGQIPAKLVHQDDELVAFVDINPQAPTHFLIIPRRHIPTLNDLGPADDALVGKMHRLAAKLAGERGHAESGFRVVMNANRDAGQTVFHIHLHLLGGRQMGWPPG
ncbi:MAG: histidine triad nucleotide-binding protein [Anaeromyxobacter sp.]